MRPRGLKALLLKRQANFSWFTGGGLNLVSLTTEVGAAALLVREDAKFVVANNIEAPRLLKEEALEEQGFEVVSFPWPEDQEADIVKRLAQGGSLGADVPFPGAAVLAEDIARLRFRLTPEEVERYRWLGRRVSLALEKTLLETRRGEKESEVVGRLCGGLWAERIDPVTLMAAADERAFTFRHPIPTEKRIDQYLMVSVNARKWGLVVSLTRFVHFGKPPAELKRKYLDNVHIDCVFMASSRPGVLAREVLRRGVEAYREMGYAEEWRLHHQGGAIGYTGRDYRTNFQTPDVIEENQALTWNPSLTGTKSEDTILVTSQGPELITHPVLFPAVRLNVEGLAFERPDILVKD